MKILPCTTPKQSLARIYKQLCTVNCYEWQLEHPFYKSSYIRWLQLKLPSLKYHVLKISGTQKVNTRTLTFYPQLHHCVSDTLYPQCSGLHATVQTGFPLFTQQYIQFHRMKHTNYISLTNFLLSGLSVVHGVYLGNKIWGKSLGWKMLVCFSHKKIHVFFFYFHHLSPTERRKSRHREQKKIKFGDIWAKR